MNTIIHLRSSFNAGGTENLIVRLFNESSSRFRIVLILMKPGVMMNDLKGEGNKVYPIYRTGKFDLKFFFRMLKVVRRERPDALHTHQLVELAYAVIFKIIFPGLRLYHHIHLHNPVKSLSFKIERTICRYFVRKVITVSETLKEYVIANGFPESKTIVLYNIVSATKNVNQEERKKFLKAIHYTVNDFLIGMIGNFVEEKDQETLAKAFKSLLPEHHNIKLIFIGSENNSTEISKNIFSSLELETKVFFQGQVPNASEYIALFNLMVFSSKIETFGIAALESLLYEVPVIASDIPVMIELSDSGRFFDLFPVRDYIALAGLIERDIKNGVDKNRTSLARQYVSDKFSPRKYVEQLEMIYECD